MLCCLRADRKPTRGRLAAFAVSASLALLTHYFAVFLLIPMAAWLLRRRSRLRVTLPAIALIAAVGIAELPLISAQGGHGTQWISAWALGSRVAAIPQYYLTGYSGASLGHSIELLVALALLAGIGLGLRRGLTRPERTGALLALGLAACGVLVPLLLAILGADYLAPRNVIAAMIPATAAVAVIALAFTALSIDVNLSPRLQRADWRAVAHVLAHELGTTRSRAITTIELGSAPLEYYLPPLHNLFAHQTVRVSEIDETGYPPLRPGAGVSPAPGFRLRASYDIHGLILYRFTSAVPRVVSQATLLRHVITAAPRQVLVPGSGVTASAAP
jgi:hypothetical protein